MLIFTNRDLLDRTDESAFTRTFTPAAMSLGFATVVPAAGGAPGWSVSGLKAQATDADALNALLPLFAGPRPLLVHLHGNSNPPASCFARCLLLESMYGFEVVGFSWASEGFLPDGSDLPGLPAQAAPRDENDLGAVNAANRRDDVIQDKIRRYRQAKTNAQDSVDALARFLRLLGTARLHANTQPFTLAAHSLGAHFLQYTLDVSGASESLGTAHNVALLAPCTRAAGHRDWLAKIRPKGQVFVTFNQGDNVLFGAFIADGGQVKLGTDPRPDLLETGMARYVSFTGAQVGFGGHDYFVLPDMPTRTLKLFTRIFGSRRDIQPGEIPRQVYPVGCDADGLTCYMAAPRVVDGGG